MANDKILRMQQLIRELNEASNAYYNGRPELMTDYEWDARFDELRRLEQETATTCPTLPLSAFRKTRSAVRRRSTSLRPSRWPRPSR